MAGIPGLGSVWSRITGGVVSFAAGAAMSDSLRPIFYDLEALANSEHPSRRLSEADLANAVVQGHLDEGAAEAQAREVGIDGDRFRLLVNSAGEPPGIETVLELWRRGVLNEVQVEQAIRESRVKPKYTQPLTELRRTHLTPADAAAAVVRQRIPDDRGREIAALAGIEAEDFALLVDVGGRPIGTAEALELVNRGEMTEAEFSEVVARSDVRTEYTPFLLKLRRRLIGLPQAVEAVLRERMSKAEGRQIAAQHGLEAADFDQLVDLTGRPIPPGQALELLRRGDFTEAQFREAIARSDVRTEYTPFLLRLRERLPSLFQVRTAVQSGAVTKELALQTLMKQGYSHEWAASIVNSASPTKTGKHRDLAESQIQQLYEARAIPRAEAVTLLQGLGFDQAEAGFVLELADVRRTIGFRERSISLVYNRFVQHQLDEAAAVTALDALSVPPDQRNDLLEVWKVDRANFIRELTEAQIVKSVKKGNLSPADGLARLVRLQYREADARILLANDGITV